MATNYVTTNLAMETKWGKEKANTKMLRVDLFSAVEENSDKYPNEMIRYAICKQDDNNKFTDQFAVNLSNNYVAHYLIADEMLKRIMDLLNGKQLESSPIIIDNSPRGNYKEATRVITFDAYYNKEKGIPAIMIKIQKKESSEVEKFDTESFYFGVSKSVRRFNKEEKPQDYNVFQFFMKLKMMLQGLIDGSSMAKTIHNKKIAELNKDNIGNGNNYKNKSKAEKQAYTKDAKNKADDYDDEEFPY